MGDPRICYHRSAGQLLSPGGGSRVHACVCTRLRVCGLLSFLCGHDHPCSVETEAPHVGLPSSPMGIRRPSGGGESHAHHVRDLGRLSLHLWGASSLFIREDGASKALAVTLTLVVGICLFPKTRERGEESLPLAQGCTLAFTRRCHCRLKPVRQGQAGALSAKHEGDFIMGV